MTVTHYLSKYFTWTTDSDWDLQTFPACDNTGYKKTSPCPKLTLCAPRAQGKGSHGICKHCRSKRKHNSNMFNDWISIMLTRQKAASLTFLKCWPVTIDERFRWVLWFIQLGKESRKHHCPVKWEQVRHVETSPAASNIHTGIGLKLYFGE